MSALDVSKCLDDMNNDYSRAGTWATCMLGPFTIILSQKILFEHRKMGTFWEAAGKPNFHPIVYNMGGPLFVFGWFMLWLGTSGVSMDFGKLVYEKVYVDGKEKVYLPLFLNW